MSTLTVVTKARLTFVSVANHVVLNENKYNSIKNQEDLRQ